MPEWNKPVVAQPGSGMSFLSNALADVPGARIVVVDVGQSSQTLLSAPPRSGMSVLHNEQMLKQAIDGAQLAKKVANTLRDSINAAFKTLGDIVLEEVLITFPTKSGKDLLINPFDQASIDAAKAEAPGEGVGPAISAHLVGLICRGLITNAEILPAEYRHLSALIGTSLPQAAAVTANCDTKENPNSLWSGA